MKDLSQNTIRAKIARYCAYRERAEKEVREKLASFEIDDSLIDQFIDELKREGFIDDQRFAIAFAGGKFRTKKWGRMKIKRELKMRNISEADINAGLREIDGQQYLETLEQLAVKKFKLVKDHDLFIRKNKTAYFLSNKGFESDLVWEMLNKLGNQKF